MKERQANNQFNWLAKDLRKIILISGILIIILVGLSVYNLKTGFLDNLAERVMEKLIGR